MRYIDPQLVSNKLPPGWIQQAQQAEVDVNAAQPKHRSAEVNRHSHVWQSLKDTLKSISHEKCWYCESIDIRADNAVDHFRPKNSVAECPAHEGYWWLAFKWENYRFCCTFCNCHRKDQATEKGGGKADQFPLKDEANRAQTPTDNLSDENPMLIDPCVSADPGFLWFDDDGQATPAPVCGTDPAAYPHQRASTSITVYHLNQPALADQRKQLFVEIRRRVKDADRYFSAYDRDATARGAFEDAIRDLRGYLTESSRYSSAARAMLMGLRGSHPIVDVVLAVA